MEKTFILSLRRKTKIDPDRILVERESSVATVYSDGNVSLNKQMLSIKEIDEINTIAKNFYLFFNNLG